jgi:hypothetical protein
MAWLDDVVHSIRRAATENLMQLTEVFGEARVRVGIRVRVGVRENLMQLIELFVEEWAVEHRLPRIELGLRLRLCLDTNPSTDPSTNPNTKSKTNTNPNPNA